MAKVVHNFGIKQFIFLLDFGGFYLDNSSSAIKRTRMTLIQRIRTDFFCIRVNP
jgi:hypothetical protein